MNKVIVLRALPWGRDTRAERWARLYPKHQPMFGVWGQAQPELGVHSITQCVRNPQAKLRIGIAYIWFSLACFWFVLRHAKKNDVIVFVDLETILFSWIAALLKGARMHYDMADPFYLVKPIPLKSLWKWIERLFVINVPRVTAPHVSRLYIFTESLLPSMSVIENIPDFPALPAQPITHTPSHEKLVLGYFGGLEAQHRGLEKIAQLVLEDERLSFLVAGSGPLAAYFERLSQQCERIHFKGPFSAKDLPSLAEAVDVYIGYYSPEKALHAIAAPNKYYEHLYLGKPLLTSCIIPQAVDIIQYQTGWCIDNDGEALQQWKNDVLTSPPDWKAMAQRCYSLWQQHYAHYYQHRYFE